MTELEVVPKPNSAIYELKGKLKDYAKKLMFDMDDDGYDRTLEEFEIIETVRTGAISLERGTQNIYDQTKEKGEFDYGKNVL